MSQINKVDQVEVEVVEVDRKNKLSTENLRNIIKRICDINHIKFNDTIIDINDLLPANFNQISKSSSNDICSAFTKSGTPCKKFCTKDSKVCAIHLKPTVDSKKFKKTSDIQCAHVLGNGDKTRQCKNKALVGNDMCHNHKL